MEETDSEMVIMPCTTTKKHIPQWLRLSVGLKQISIFCASKMHVMNGYDTIQKHADPMPSQITSHWAFSISSVSTVMRTWVRWWWSWALTQFFQSYCRLRLPPNFLVRSCYGYLIPLRIWLCKWVSFPTFRLKRARTGLSFFLCRFQEILFCSYFNLQ